MKAFDAGCGDQEFAQVFVKDEFYESFEAPKFHDFTAPEEPIDPDAWFSAKAGMTRKEEARIQEYESFLLNPKTQKILVLEQKKTVIMDSHKTASGSLLQAPHNFSAAKKALISSSRLCCLLAFAISSLKIVHNVHPFSLCWPTQD